MPTMRYIINRDEEMDAAKINWPFHISQRDSGLGHGDHAWIIECGGVAIGEGEDAIREIYPNAQVTANRHQAFKILSKE